MDTDLVRDAKADLPTFLAMRRRLPWPARTVTSVDACATAMVRGIEKRARRVYVPRSIALVNAIRPLLVSPLADALMGRRARTLVPQMEDEIARLGRPYGEHTAPIQP